MYEFAWNLRMEAEAFIKMLNAEKRAREAG
jgi:hypothetical protein